ncbi:MAG: glycosyltransferase family 39 protein [Candidatus Paceibacterota bacterium]|jgi:hypothetical protein|nr:glycosyltransferase family 39 protein [Candidatus Paceibacterota bacterium]
MALITRIKQNVLQYPGEWIVGLFSVIASGATAIRLTGLHMVSILGDQSAHLIFSRLLFDSLTPGISQLGIWPPMLHIVMAPYAASRPLFESGLAGFFALIPFFAASAIFLYKISYRLIHSKWLSVFAAILYASNPFILYYSATPMMEILLLCFIFSTAYYTMLWIETDQLLYLLFAGLSIALATLSRFEGLLLIPAVSVIVFFRMIGREYSYPKIEATFILFWMLAGIGVLELALYDLVYFSNPLAFIGIGASPIWNLEGIGGPSVVFAGPIETFLHASYYMIGAPLVLLSLFTFILPLIRKKDRVLRITALSILAIPAIAVLINMMRNSSTIYVPEFSPLHDFHNVRYALTWMGFVSLSITLFVSTLLSLKTRMVKFYSTLVLLLAAGAGIYHFYTFAMVDPYSVIARDRSAIRSTEANPVSIRLAREYDFGYVFTNRFSNDKVLVESGLPLRKFIYEGNEFHYDETLEHPWLFARFILMSDPNKLSNNAARSPLTEKWYGTPEFDAYYETLYTYSGTSVYRIREAAVLQYVTEKGIDVLNTPSLDRRAKLWDRESPDWKKIDDKFLIQ